MKLTRLFAGVLTIVGFMLLAPNSAKCELDVDSGFELGTIQDYNLDLHFSGFDVATGASTEDDYHNAFLRLDAQAGYWFEDLPWLGITSKAPALQRHTEELDTSMAAETGFDPLSSFLLFRYQSQEGKLQPYLGVGPSHLISDLGHESLGTFRRMFFGISYRF